MRLRQLWMLSLLPLLLFACGNSGGSDSSGGSGAASTADIDSLCGGYCEWKGRCGTGTPTCKDKCNSDSAEYAGKWSTAYTGAVSSCFSSLACDKKEDDCIASFGLADPQYPDIDFVTACLRKREECSQLVHDPDGGAAQPVSTFSDDLCQSIAALTRSARIDADQCRGLGCGEVGSCLKKAGAFSF